MTGNECYRASLVVLGAGADSGEYYAQFALGALNQLLANSLREINAERVQQGEAAFSVPPCMNSLDEDVPAPEWLVRECFPYGPCGRCSARTMTRPCSTARQANMPNVCCCTARRSSPPYRR